MKENKPEAAQEDRKLLQDLKERYDLAKTYYTPEHRKMNLLDATDKGKLWEALRAKFPPYQILPDTNFISYIKMNILASIYTVAKSAEVIPTSQDDAEICTKLNIALEKVWDLCDVGFFQFQAGERAALLNLGITQVGWSEELSGGCADSFYKGNIVLKNIDPLKYMRDPFADSLETSGWCCTYDEFHKSVLLRNPLYKESFQKYLAQKKQGSMESLPKYDSERPQNVSQDHYTLFKYWVREKDAVHEYHILDNEYLLWKNENIVPAEFPIAELYCNLPGTMLVGASEPMKCFANNVAANLMDSIALTAEYKNQRPPKFVNSASGLNLAAFTKHGDEADRTFVVNGDATKAVHYHEFPMVSPQLQALRQGLQYGIENMTGIDSRYTGRDTGSIITTGGTEEMLNRVTLIDTPKIKAYERYTRQLTKLILSYLLEHCPKRKYLYKAPNSTEWTTLEVDFPEIPSDTLYQYTINISSELPKNKSRVAAMANMLMEKQMQYREQGSGGVELITEEEWLQMQDLPNKERMLERMGFQRDTDALKEASQTIFSYAKLVEQGMDPNQALLATAEMMKRSRMGMSPQPDNIDLMQQQAEVDPMGMQMGNPIPQMPV